MSKPISRKMAVSCVLFRFVAQHGVWLPCSICGKDILIEDEIQFDHIHADIFSGPHEYQNLRPVHTECHKIKTKADIQANAKIKRITNPKPSKRPMKSGKVKMQSRPFQKRKKP